jgi:KaiC/GvpD/RAD55 family RecA-like ATPase
MHLKFGIPSLDELVQVPEQATSTALASCPTSLAIIGPDGTGKSVFALHLASRYLADCMEAAAGDVLPHVIYVSSDFKHGGANRVWDIFKLNGPNWRQIPFERTPTALRRFAKKKINLELVHVVPSEPQNGQVAIEKFLTLQQTSRESAKVGFVDLASFTTGDDWNFTNSIIAKLASFDRFSTTENGVKEKAPHLVIIDSVAGFETYIGDIDAYGLKQTRRARIAQAIRNAGSECHLVFVVEEPKERGSLPEEYVTDLVLRLRARHGNGVTQRTVEVEKARSRNHATGEHPFAIRGADGSSTGTWENPDTPRSRNAYVNVFKALPQRMASIASEYGKGKSANTSTEVAPFGIFHLDELLEVEEKGSSNEGEKQKGLRLGSTCGLIGESSTGKSSLAGRFLIEDLRKTLEQATALFRLLVKQPTEVVTDPLLAQIVQILREPLARVSDQTPDRAPSTAPEVTTENAKQVLEAIATALAIGTEATVEELPKMTTDELKNEDLHDLDKRCAAFHDLRVGAAEGPKVREDGTREGPEPPRSRSHLVPHLKKLHTDIEAVAKTTSVQSWLGAGEAADLVKTIFRHPNLRRPAILLTTSDRNYDTLLPRFAEYFKASDGNDLGPELTTALKEIVGEQLIIRRFDAGSMDAPTFFHIVQHNIVEAQRLIHGACFPPSHRDRARKSGRIRLVIDDFKVLAGLCPAIVQDTTLLPFLTFHLEREGVTTLFVYTESMRPFKSPSDPLARMLQPLVKHAILTWGVAFGGQSRIAISVVGQRKPEYHGLVRELVEDNPNQDPDQAQDHSYPWVSRHFELFTGIEKDDPKLIPLEVNIFAATSGFKRYLEQEEVMFRTQFEPVARRVSGRQDTVLVPVDASKYYAIRDITHLPWDVKADHTIIDQVDGFWSLDAATGSLASQRDYLFAPRKEANEDRFHLFTKPQFTPTPQKAPFQRRYFFQNAGYKARIVDFDLANSPLNTPDRVPFTWDFSFVLAPVGAWEAASVSPIPFAPEAHTSLHWGDTKDSKGEGVSVHSVLARLREDRDKRIPVPWRHFFGACKVVADQALRNRGYAPTAFDFACTSAETLSSLFLEIWFSEYHQEVSQLAADDECRIVWSRWLNRITSSTYSTLDRKSAAEFSLLRLFQGGSKHADSFAAVEKFFREKIMQRAAASSGDPDKRRRDAMDREDGLFRAEDEPGRTLLGAWKAEFGKMNLAALTLYKTWLLLLEVMDFEAILDPDSPFEMKQPKESSPHAVAARHYYRTACEMQADRTPTDKVDDGHYVLAMPGLFAVRGDSFLASPEASRSRLLAYHAMDILTSRRANLTRMQLGVGLPVRDVLGDDACKQMRTALRARVKSPRTHEFDSIGQVTYEHLYQLGGTNLVGEIESNLDNDASEWRTRWLHRNGLPEYDRVSRVLQKWIVRLFQWTVQYRAKHQTNWEGGLFAYDALSAKRFARLINYGSFSHFGRQVDYLVAELTASERDAPANGDQSE